MAVAWPEFHSEHRCSTVHWDSVRSGRGAWRGGTGRVRQSARRPGSFCICIHSSAAHGQRAFSLLTTHFSRPNRGFFVRFLREVIFFFVSFDEKKTRSPWCLGFRSPCWGAHPVICPSGRTRGRLIFNGSEMREFRWMLQDRDERREQRRVAHAPRGSEHMCNHRHRHRLLFPTAPKKKHLPEPARIKDTTLTRPRLYEMILMMREIFFFRKSTPDGMFCYEILRQISIIVW